MKLEVGKSYVTKSGITVGPMQYFAGLKNVLTGYGLNTLIDYNSAVERSTAESQAWNLDGSVYRMRVGEEDDEIVAEASVWAIYLKGLHTVNHDDFEYSYTNDGEIVAFRKKPKVPIITENRRVYTELVSGWLDVKEVSFSLASNATMLMNTRNGVPVGTWTIEFDQK